MRSEIQKTTVAFQELQWKLQDQMELLHDTMKSTSVNEQQALAQLDRVLDVEREIKRLHIGLAVRLKNRAPEEPVDAGAAGATPQNANGPSHENATRPRRGAVTSSHNRTERGSAG
jgi:hypothetical protein